MYFKKKKNHKLYCTNLIVNSGLNHARARTLTSSLIFCKIWKSNNKKIKNKNTYIKIVNENRNKFSKSEKLIYDSMLNVLRMIHGHETWVGSNKFCRLNVFTVAGSCKWPFILIGFRSKKKCLAKSNFK